MLKINLVCGLLFLSITFSSQAAEQQKKAITDGYNFSDRLCIVLGEAFTSFTNMRAQREQIPFKKLILAGFNTCKVSTDSDDCKIALAGFALSQNCTSNWHSASKKVTPQMAEENLCNALFYSLPSIASYLAVIKFGEVTQENRTHIFNAWQADYEQDNNQKKSVYGTAFVTFMTQCPTGIAIVKGEEQEN